MDFTALLGVGKVWVLVRLVRLVSWDMLCIAVRYWRGYSTGVL